MAAVVLGTRRVVVAPFFFLAFAQRARGVVLGTRRVVITPLFFLAFVRGAVTVISVETGLPGFVLVTSWIGTNEEQNAEASRLFKMAAHATTSSRASMSALSTAAAETEKECSAMMLRRK